MAHSRIYVNGDLVADENRPVRDSFAAMLQCLDPFSAPDVLTDNINTICDLMVEHCADERELYCKSNRAAFTRMISTVEKTRHRLINPVLSGEQDRVEAFNKAQYQIILALEGLGELPGFGVTNAFGDKMFGDPEKKSILNARRTVDVY